MRFRHLSLSTFALAAALPLCVWAADVKMPDPDLPQPLNLQNAQSILESSPFTRTLDLSDTLMLTGIAYVQGKPVATISNRVTKQSYLVSEEPNAQGWRLTEAQPSSEPRRTQVKLMVGPEVVTIHYADAQLAPTTSLSKYAPSHTPTKEEFTGHDEHGKEYVRGSVYLSDADRDRYHKELSKEAHNKFRDLIRDNRDKMFSMSTDERTTYAKKVFDEVSAEDRKRKR
jgi:hypothetical protein